MSRAMWDKLPQDVQDMVLGHLVLALKWRGWDRRSSDRRGEQHATEEVRQIAEVLLENGCEVEEYC